MIKCRFENGNEASLRHVCVDMLVLRTSADGQGEEVLLVRRAPQLLEGGKWALIGGYMERDENLQEAAAREIFEESGYRVKDLTLLTVHHRPDRPHEDRQNISFVFFCQAQNQEGASDWEVTEQTWFSLNALPPLEELAFDHALDIQMYQQFRKEKTTLPIIP
jgi:ADP-ribose pyrophosphatase YjhB (NUDIX family)